MSNSRLPAIAKSFFRDFGSSDRERLLELLDADAVFDDGDMDYRGPLEIITRLEHRYSRGGWRVVSHRAADGVLIVTTLPMSGAACTSDTALDWRLSLAGGRITRMEVRSHEWPEVPPVVAGFVHAVNFGDAEALLALFCDDALVNDELVDYRDPSAIRGWAERNIFDTRLTLFIESALHRDERVLLTCHATGDFEEAGLPDPLVLAMYFLVKNERVSQLIILPGPLDS